MTPFSTNFLHLHTAQAKKQSRIFKRSFFIRGAIVLLLFFLLIGVFAFRLERSFRFVYAEALLGKNAFQEARAYIVQRDLEQSISAFARAAEHVHAARQEYLRWRMFFSFPWIGKQLEAVDALLATTEDMMSTMHDAVRWVRETSTLIPTRANVDLATLTSEEKEPVLHLLTTSLPFWHTVESRVAESTERLSRVPADELVQPLRALIVPVQKELVNLDHMLKIFVTLIEILPDFSGYPTAKTYLFLLQNSDELRPTGGFIGTYGVINVDQGAVKRFETYDVYELDKKAEREKRKLPDAPAEIHKHLGVAKFFFRDANWSPDFRVSAEELIERYKDEGGAEKNIDGILAVTPFFIERLLMITGPLTIENQTFSASNFIDILEYEVEQAFVKKNIPVEERKAIVGKLANELVAKLFTLPIERLPEVLTLVDEALQEKHILFYANNPNVQSILERENWAGRMREAPPGQDFLMVVDANLAALKTDRVVDRSISYHLTFVPETKTQPRALKARVKLVYKNKGAFDWRTTRYRTYTRLFVPQGSQLVASRGAMKKDRDNAEGPVETGEELGKTFFGAFLSVEPGETKTLEFEYLLPTALLESLVKDAYTLTVQKQPGIPEIPLAVDLSFGNPSFFGKRYTIHTWEPKGFEVKQRSPNHIRFESLFRTDRIYRVLFE